MMRDPEMCGNAALAQMDIGFGLFCVVRASAHCHQFIPNAFAAGKPFGGRPSAISHDRAKRGRARRALPFGLVGLGTLNRKEGGKEEKKREEKKKEKRDEKMPDRP